MTQCIGKKTTKFTTTSTAAVTVNVTIPTDTDGISYANSAFKITYKILYNLGGSLVGYLESVGMFSISAGSSYAVGYDVLVQVGPSGTLSGQALSCPSNGVFQLSFSPPSASSTTFFVVQEIQAYDTGV
jgi:hypothetical protein